MFNLPVNIDDIVAKNPRLVETLQPQDHKLLAQAAHLRLDDAFKRMLAAGFDPNATALDGGTALHQAAWTGGAELVELILKTGKCDLEQRDSTHGSTPLGWATHGSANCRHRQGDYERTVRLLVAAGAKMDVPANSSATTFVQQAQGNPAIQALLRELGAT
jgi:ankyrin repeat protein